MKSEKDDFGKQILQMIEQQDAYSAGNFAKSSISDVTKFRNAAFAMVQSQTD